MWQTYIMSRWTTVFWNAFFFFGCVDCIERWNWRKKHVFITKQGNSIWSIPDYQSHTLYLSLNKLCKNERIINLVYNIDHVLDLLILWVPSKRAHHLHQMNFDIVNVTAKYSLCWYLGTQSHDEQHNSFKKRKEHPLQLLCVELICVYWDCRTYKGNLFYFNFDTCVLNWTW